MEGNYKWFNKALEYTDLEPTDVEIILHKSKPNPKPL